MMGRVGSAGRGERLILFTLVDLLVQIIFFGLFAVVLFQSGHKELPAVLNNRLAPYARVAQAELVSFVDAVSRLVPLQDVGRNSSIGSQDDRIRSELASLTTALRALKSESDIRALERLGAQLGAKHLRMSDLTALNERYLSMTTEQRVKLISDAQAIQRPRCFAGVEAFAVEEIPGGYTVSRPIAAMAEAFKAAVSGLPQAGGDYFVSQGSLNEFGTRLIRAFRNCNIRVKESSVTNNLRQYRLLNEYFLLE